MLDRRFSLIRKSLAKALHLLFIAALLALALGTTPAKPVQADPAPLAGAVSPGGLLNPDGTLDTTTGFQGTLDLRGWEVTLDGDRGPLLKQANNPDYPPLAWHALPNQGLYTPWWGRISALAVSGGDLYVGGLFTGTGDLEMFNLDNIACYDTTAGAWHRLPNVHMDEIDKISGMDSVSALAVSGGDLYVGGSFEATDVGLLTDLSNIARYDTIAEVWHALPNQGLNVPGILEFSGVSALAVSGDDLYVGGWFTQTGDGTLTDLGNIARYDTTAGAWQALPNQGLKGSVSELAVSGDYLYVGGGFTQTGDGSLTDLGYIARYDTTTGAWQALLNQGLKGGVSALAVSGDYLYVGGSFEQTGDGTLTNMGKIARYDTTTDTWHALPNQGLNDDVISLAVSGDDLYVGGEFSGTSDGSLTDLGQIARYDTAAGAWHALPNQGLDTAFPVVVSGVHTLAVSGSDLYVGGDFDQTGDGLLTDLGNIARCTLFVNLYLPLVVR